MNSRLLLICAASAAAVAVAVATAPALTVRATPKQITASGVGAVKLGRTHGSLHAAGLVGKIGKGCELAGPNTRSARLRAPLSGGVDYTRTSPRKVVNVTVLRGAAARGVGIGATAADIKQAFPRVVARNVDQPFGLTLYIVPKRDGGKLTFGVDNDTKKVTIVGVPDIPFCD
jgi:hypothetical protein